MSEYRRSFIDGGTYFFTVVTYQRQPILTDSLSRALLRAAWLDVSNRFPFTTEAICLLPDHLHCVLTLPPGDSNYPMRWKEIKRLFTRAYLSHKKEPIERNISHQKREEATIWQRRYWEHSILDEEDFNHHLHYIHYNPVKHGYVQSVSEWTWSSFHRYVKDGFYEKGWGDKIDMDFSSQYGE
ncbi:MAG: transposase [Anaerolineaceae bacterium]|jgi:putative transposase|nr:MAG: transposase [Anaerolineaceae bacterium]